MLRELAVRDEALVGEGLEEGKQVGLLLGGEGDAQPAAGRAQGRVQRWRSAYAVVVVRQYLR